MPKQIRTFIAIDITEQMRQELSRIQSQLKPDLAGKISWVRPENIHITLRFLGDIGQQMLSQIKQIIADTADTTSGFSVDLGELGAFPKAYNPRVIWVGIKSGQDKLKALHTQLQEKLNGIGFAQEEKDFHPHLTIARIKLLKDKQALENLLHQIKPRNLSTAIDRIILFQSQLSQQESIYSKLFEQKLKM